MNSLELSDQQEDDPGQPASPGRGPDRLAQRPEAPAESEMLLKKAFESDTNTGIELLFRWYYRPLCSHVVRYVSSKEIAEDIVSEVFYKESARNRLPRATRTETSHCFRY